MNKHIETSDNTTEELANIPATGFVEAENETVTETRKVKFNTRGHLKLSAFSVEQLLLAEPVVQYGDSPNLVNALRKLGQLAINSHRSTEEQPFVLVEYAEVLQMRTLLEARMKHCEKDLNNDIQAKKALVNEASSYGYSTDEESLADFVKAYPQNALTPKHNPATYVAQKHLLLELRLWLCGDIVD